MAQPAHDMDPAGKAPVAWLARPETPEPLRMAGSVIHLGEGRAVFAEGSEAQSFYKVVSGVVRVCKLLNDGRRQIEAFHVAGDVFGFELGREHSLTAEAVNDCVLVAYRRRIVEALAQKDCKVGQQLFRFAVENLSRAQHHALLMGRRGAMEKVASFLLGWATQFGAAKLIPLAMTRQDIADYLGLTIETVSRSLSQLEREGVIALPGIREVRLNSHEALEALAA